MPHVVQLSQGIYTCTNINTFSVSFPVKIATFYREQLYKGTTVPMKTSITEGRRTNGTETELRIQGLLLLFLHIQGVDDKHA